MPASVVTASGLSKRYRLGERRPYETLRESVTLAIRSAVAGGSNNGTRLPEQFVWALRDVSFEIQKGQTVGIIGRNGAGKSTLLKVLARITRPTAGSALVAGRVGSLLEVGSGFHPELSGRENVYLNASLLGMKRREVENKFDEIVAFSELEGFLDTPVKRYSSGMYMRLAFSVAAHLETEILLIDEVLAVGDAAFQQKCLGRMGDIARQGRTILFVSHNLLSVESLCDRVMWLDDGRVAADGAPRQVVSQYMGSTVSAAMERVFENPPAAEGISLTRVSVVPQLSDADQVDVRTPFAIEFEYANVGAPASIFVSLRVFNEHDILLFDICPPMGATGTARTGNLRTTCEIPGDLLNAGLHRIAVAIVRDKVTIIEEPHALVFRVNDALDDRGAWYGDWPGAIRPSFKWKVEAV